MKTIFGRLAALITCITLLFAATNTVASEYPRAERDFRGLPKYCRAKLQKGFATPDMHKRFGRGLQGFYGDSHHYCAAMHSFQHADGMIPAKEPKKYWLGRVIDNIEYMENHATNKGHKVYAEMYLLKARAYLMQKQIGQAFIYFEKSLAVNPKYTATYREQIKYYLSLNDKKSALDVVNRGLEHKPTSKSLLRIKSELSGR